MPPTSSRACQSPPPRTAVSSTYGSYKVWAQRKPLHVEGAHAGPGLGLKPAVMALYRALRRAARLLARALLLSALTAAAAARAALTPRARRPPRVRADMSTANACPKMSGGISPSAESIRASRRVPDSRSDPAARAIGRIGRFDPAASLSPTRAIRARLCPIEKSPGHALGIITPGKGGFRSSSLVFWSQQNTAYFTPYQWLNQWA